MATDYQRECARHVLHNITENNLRTDEDGVRNIVLRFVGDNPDSTSEDLVNVNELVNSSIRDIGKNAPLTEWERDLLNGDFDKAAAPPVGVAASGERHVTIRFSAEKTNIDDLATACHENEGITIRAGSREFTVELLYVKEN